MVQNIKSLDNIPVFIYHVEDNEELFKKLIMMKDVKVILNQHDYINYYNMSCSGQQNPDTILVNFSAFAGGSPSLN
ncbi:MAG: hypothetical protein CMP47_02825 [Rickettsiales bacterium]|nr:hypothetical protein [Rickettsiales bacterium]